MLTVRLATEQDIDQVVTLRMAFLTEMRPQALDRVPEVLALTRQYVQEKLPAGEFLVWLAEEDGQVVGTGGLVYHSRPPTLGNPFTLHGYVLNMYTLPQHRRRGIGSRVLGCIIDHVRGTPAGRITLHASKLGRPLYERFGFTSYGDEMTLAL